MLTSLSIKNYALIDDIKVDFNSGLTIITGETGAGKSILLGALGLVLGKRADLSSVRDNSVKCIVEAVFDIANYNLKPLFNIEDLDYETQTILRREILPSGKSRSFVNDTPVNLQSLSKLGEHLIDIHSQHQTLELANNQFQFQVIDALAGNKDLLNEYATYLGNYKQAQLELNDLLQLQSDAIKEQDYNTFLLNELEDAKLVEGEQEALETEYETLNNVEDISEQLQKVNAILSEDQTGVLQLLQEIKQSLQRLKNYSESYSELFNRADSSLIELNDIFSEIEIEQENLEADPKRLETVNGKLQILHNLYQKHQAASISELINIKESLSEKIEVTEQLDDTIHLKRDDIERLESALNTLGESIHSKRKETIPVLKQELESSLKDLGMADASFKIEIKLSDSFYFNGQDDLQFLFSANKGGNYNELKKSASGGELSRIMLSIKSMLSKYINLPTIMFDEIDTGVSGDISNKIATIMQHMSKEMQVFAITHLPQIAAKGDSHYKVYKETQDSKTATNLRRLNQDERIVEIAQMLSGKEVTDSAVAHAKQLLN